MLKVSLVSILIVVSTVWWLEERPQLTATRLAVEEALINHGYLAVMGFTVSLSALIPQDPIQSMRRFRD